MAEYEDVEPTSPHKHTKNTSACATGLSEYHPETGRVPVTKGTERFHRIRQDGKKSTG